MDPEEAVDQIDDPVVGEAGAGVQAGLDSAVEGEARDADLDDQPFIRKALVDELTIAELYAPTAPVVLTGNLDSIDFSSGITDAAWILAVTVASSNGTKISALETYRFTSSWYGETACNQTAHALMPAVQNLVGRVVRNAGFPELLRAKP